MITEEASGAFRCNRIRETYDLIQCPFGYVPLSREQLATSCPDMGYPCPENVTECLCHPCVPLCGDDETVTRDGECRCKRGLTKFGGKKAFSSSFLLRPSSYQRVALPFLVLLLTTVIEQETVLPTAPSTPSLLS